MSRITTRTRGALLVLLAVLWAAPPVHADIIGAFQAYKKGDYPHAFQEFLALAKLGQPLAQFDVATLYQAGQGTPASAADAYAWATLAAASGEESGKKLADEIRPHLGSASEQAAGTVVALYRNSVLQQTLLPDLSDGPPVTPLDPALDCDRKAVKMYMGKYPEAARREHVEGAVFVEFTLMPDGSPRFPRIIEAVPAGIFETMVRESLLGSQFSREPPGSAPVQCTIPYNFIFTGRRIGGGRASMEDFEAELGYRTDLENLAKNGAPDAQLVYGLLLDGPFKEEGDRSGASKNENYAGLPWLVKAAQAGEPVAQYEVAHSLLEGRGCRRDEIKGLKWLRMAAEQDEPNADITLAARLLRGKPSVTDVTQAKGWLERAAAQNEDNGIPNSSNDARLLLAAILAATPQAALRDPVRALDLLKRVHDVEEDPTPFEIAAAAQAAQGHFSDAVRSEQTAISRAGQLGWDLSPLKQRLSLYQSSKPWYGSLLEF
ncbi:MAG: energy transducer TonB [Steroidobacteraceae bacterium]